MPPAEETRPAPADPPRPGLPRPIVDFTRDADGDWVARLECGHRRHVRHHPPLASYPWIDDDAARAARVGAAIECDRCARAQLPADAVAYRSTAEFDEATLPAGLRRDHSTRPGVWGRVEVLAGRLRFVMPALAVDLTLAADEHTIIPPGVVHHVEPLGPVRLRVVFLRVPPPAP